jgi:hypothetical protein
MSVVLSDARMAIRLTPKTPVGIVAPLADASTVGLPVFDRPFLDQRTLHRLSVQSSLAGGPYPNAVLLQSRAT